MLETEAELTLETRDEEHSQQLVLRALADAGFVVTAGCASCRRRRERLNRDGTAARRASSTCRRRHGTGVVAPGARMLAAMAARAPLSQIVTIGRSVGRSAPQMRSSRYGMLRLPGM